jgi:pimeloyl-ACP methyl ester carboxylesterase
MAMTMHVVIGLRKTGRRLIRQLAVAAVSVTMAGTAASAQPPAFSLVKAAGRTAPALRTTPHAFKLRDGRVLATERGEFEVLERRSDPSSRRIRIGFVRFRSTSSHPGAPIVYLAGGPGGSGIDAAKGPRQPIFLALRALGDVIALDQRGVGISNAIPSCRTDAALDPAGGLSEATLTRHHRDALLKCVERWRAAGVAIEGYTTTENADDVEDLRRALGVPKLRLWGISYGTHLALEVIRRHPKSVDRAVLASVEGMDQTAKLPSRVDAALGRLVRSVDAGATGASLLATMRRVHARLDAKPEVMTVGEGAEAIRFTIDSFPLRMLVGGIAKNPAGIGQLQQLYAAFDAGQGQALAPLLYDFFLKEPPTLSGMPELMDVASGISDARLERVAREGRDAVVGTATNFPMPQLARALPEVDLDPTFRSEVRSTVPTLVLSGDLDLRTPVEEQAEATAGLANATRVPVRGGGHDLFEAHPAIPGLIADFFAGRPITATELTVSTSSEPAGGR